MSGASSHAQERGLEVDFEEGDQQGLILGLRLRSPSFPYWSGLASVPG